MPLLQRKHRPSVLVIALLSFAAAPGCGSHHGSGGAESTAAPDPTLTQPTPSPTKTNSVVTPTPVADAPAAQKQAKSPQAAGPDIVGSTTVFIGWSEESPVLRQEDSLSNGGLRTSFLRLNLDGSPTRLDPNSWHGIEKGMPPKNPPGLIQGIVLVQGGAVAASNPLVTLRIDADVHEMDAMQKALQEWNDGKRDASQGFPSVNAVLSIQFASAGRQPKPLWKESTTLGVAGGEAGFEYSDPSLSLAVLSASHKRLYFEIAFAGDNIDRHLIIVPEESK